MRRFSSIGSYRQPVRSSRAIKLRPLWSHSLTASHASNQPMAAVPTSGGTLGDGGTFARHVRASREGREARYQPEETGRREGAVPAVCDPRNRAGRSRGRRLRIAGGASSTTGPRWPGGLATCPRPVALSPASMLKKTCGIAAAARTWRFFAVHSSGVVVTYGTLAHGT